MVTLTMVRWAAADINQIKNTSNFKYFFFLEMGNLGSHNINIKHSLEHTMSLSSPEYFKQVRKFSYLSSLEQLEHIVKTLVS